MPVELLGIATDLQARRALYARFAYKAPSVPIKKRPKRPRPPPRAAFRRILVAVCYVWSVSEYEMLSPGRKARLTHPRFALYRICRERLGWSLPHIGKSASVHHTSVLHGLERAKELFRHHRDWRNLYTATLIELRGGIC